MPESAPLCFNAMNRLMPLLRASTARRLVAEGLPQDRIAEHLGVSQAMVSKYLRRTPRGATAPRLMAELVEQSVKIALEEEAKGRIPAWCPVCTSLSTKGFAVARQPLEGVPECLRQDAAAPQDESQRVLDELAAAEARIRRLPFHHLMPQVRCNLAMALTEAKTSRDVAAFPGRLVDIRGEVHAAAAPEFGSSSHLAQVLLRLRRAQPASRAILNARYDDKIRRAVRACGLRTRTLQRVRGDLAIGAPKTGPVDAAIDPGAFGVEPALYLVGTDASDVVDKAQRILQHLSNGDKK